MKTYLLAFTVSCIVVLSQQSLHRAPDSLFFIRAAELHQAQQPMRNIVHTQYSPVPYPSNGYFVQWSPGYPWVLAQSFDMGLSWQNAGRLINAVSFGVLSCCVLWFVRDLPGLFQAMAFLLLLTCSAVIASYSYLLSDMLFTCLTFVSIVTLNISLSPRLSQGLPT
jgi:hypothetical protein